MLNQETKRRIDSARDILVGKIPDPKAQVEQITTALIYKFMDDLDKESEELGGKAQFFVNEYEKYSWSKLLDTRLGGFERLNLYSEALLKMPQNPKLPQLFRNILKDSYLPYRDPETLNLFLKEINSFTYDHSEKLGDAYEYLLSVLGSQGDAGQFRTPRHIIDFIVEVVDPKKEDTILDPACGTAGFLISAYKHILKQNTIHKLGDQLTPDERTKLMNHFIGYDIAPEMVRLSLVNMYLHNFPNPNIFEYDTLTSEERWDETYDVIMANPPFMSPKGGIRPHKRFSIQVNRSEVLFVDYIAEHLTTHGRAGVIVPEGIIFQSGNAYKALRKLLVEKFLFAVVSLPGGVFQPYSGVKTSILLMDRQLAKKVDSILFINIENDGFDLGAQRRAIEKNDLTEALLIIQKYKQALQENRDVSEITSEGEKANLATLVGKAKIAKNGDYNLTGERYKENIVAVHHKWPLVELGKIINLNFGVRITKRDNEGEKYPVYGGGGESFRTNDYNREDQLVIARFAISENCVRFVHGKFYLLDSGFTYSILAEQQNFVTKSYLDKILLNIQNKIYACGRGHAQKNIDIDQFKMIKVPLPPLEFQKEIVTELDKYQKVIDGAKQVVENYYVHINVPYDCEVVELGNLCHQIQYGISEPMNTEGKGFKIFRMQEIKNGFLVDNGNMKYADIPEAEYKKYKLNEDDILFNRTNSYEWVGRTGIFKLEGEYCFASYLIRLIINKTLAIPDYINYYMNTENFQTTIKLKATRSIGQANINAKSLAEYKLPLPSLEIQRQIVTQIEKEQKHVEATKKLIEIFEQKIKEKIAEFWGESEL